MRFGPVVNCILVWYAQGVPRGASDVSDGSTFDNRTHTHLRHVRRLTHDVSGATHKQTS